MSLVKERIRKGAEDPEERAPIVVFLFPGDEIPTREEVLQQVREKKRWRRIIMCKVISPKKPKEIQREYLESTESWDFPYCHILGPNTPQEFIEYFRAPVLPSSDS